MAKNREKELIKDRETVKIEFENYQKTIAKEMELRDILEIRQKSEAEQLKEELKNAKTILQNPRLR